MATMRQQSATREPSRLFRIGPALAAIALSATVLTAAACDPAAAVPGGATEGQHLDQECRELADFFRRFSSLPDDFAERFWRAEHIAFGDYQNRITLAWEHEGGTSEILRFYRPAELTDDEWRAMSFAERQDWVSTYYGPEPFEEFYLRTDDAPAFLREELDFENGRWWETSTQGYVRTPSELMEQMNWVRANLGRGPRAPFHVHIVFRRDAQFADELTDFAAHASEYTTLRMISYDTSYVRERGILGMFVEEDLAHMRETLAAGGRIDEKAFTVGFRTTSWRGKGPLYGDWGLSGFEWRRLGDERGITNTLLFLEDPRNARIALGELGTGRTIDDLGHLADGLRVERLSEMTLYRFSDTMQSYLWSVAENVVPIQGLSVERWSIPLVRWEARPYLAPIADDIVAARQTFLRGLEQLAQSSPDPSRNARQVAEAIDRLVQNFVRETQLYEHF